MTLFDIFIFGIFGLSLLGDWNWDWDGDGNEYEMDLAPNRERTFLFSFCNFLWIID
jgi:hypothetical protein